MTETEYFTELKKRLAANPDFPDCYLRDIGSGKPFGMTDSAHIVMDEEKQKMFEEFGKSKWPYKGQLISPNHIDPVYYQRQIVDMGKEL